ncbi:MAG: hypothetical protein FWC91_01400 [Defluviitaleaceae bacterium]|nr:hypothetical protein [Defluviitaleaceae bacterium]
MPFYNEFEQIFLFLHNWDNNVVVMAIFIILHVLTIVLRLAVFFGYKGLNALMTMDMMPARGLVSKADIPTIRSSLLKRVAADYVAAAEKNAPRIPLKAIIDKHILSLSFLGWPYAGISKWIEKLESSLMLLGLALAFLFLDYGNAYILLALTGFIILKLAAAFFDYDTAKQVLVSDIHLYMEREVGQFFAGHTAGAILQFKKGMEEAVDHQNALLRGTIEKLNADLHLTLKNLECLATLPKALENMIQSNDKYALHHDTYNTQIQMIKDTQAALASSLEVYETTLQNLVQTMGNGMGTFIQLHGQNAADSLVDVMQNHMTHVIENNQQTVSSITSLMDQLTDQLRTLHERITTL